MSPKFYAILWIVFFAGGALCGIAGLLTTLTATVFGFAAFGLIFTGMMCVLPTQVGHAQVKVRVEHDKPRHKIEDLQQSNGLVELRTV